MAKEVVAKKEGGPVQMMDLSMFEEDAGRGMENMGQEDLALPFIKILSGLDTILDTHETARKGDIYNTVSGDVHSGKTGIRVIPCAYQRRFIQWSPRGIGGSAPIAIFAPTDSIPKTERSADDNKEYVVGGDGSYIEETHQHFVVVLKEDGSSETALIAMKSTQLKKSRKWNAMIQSTPLMTGKNGLFKPPRFSHVFLLKTISEENSKGAWHGWEMSKEEQLNDKALYLQARAFSESILSGDVVAKHSEDEVSDSKDIPF